MGGACIGGGGLEVGQLEDSDMNHIQTRRSRSSLTRIPVVNVARFSFYFIFFLLVVSESVKDELGGA